MNIFAILMVSAKLTTPGLLKKLYFEKKGYDFIISPTKFYHVTQTILQKWSCDQNSVTLAFL